MTGTWAPARFRLLHSRRSRIVSVVLLVLVIALTTGVAMAAVAGARRSDLAYERFLGWAHEPELNFSGCECDAQQLSEEFDRIRAAPFALDSARGGFANVLVGLEDGTRPSFLAVGPVVALDDRLGREVPRAKVLHGRLPEPDASDEASISFLAAERFSLHVGDRVGLFGYDDSETPVETVRIVGIHVAPGEFPSAGGPQGTSLLLPRGFARAHPELVDPANDSLLVNVRPGTPRAELDAFFATLRYGLDWDESSPQNKGIERTISVETIALLALALVIGTAGILLTGQMLRREADIEGADRAVLAALGWTRGDTLRLALLRGAALGLLGAISGAAIAVALSPFFPIGIGRIADPDVGWHLDTAMVVGGMLATVVCVAALAVIIAARADAATESTLARAFGARMLRGGRPVTMVGLAFSRPSGRRGAGTRLSILSLIAVTALLAATLLTVASFDHLARHRELAGATWSAVVLPPPDAAGNVDVEAALEQVRAVPGVEAATRGGWASSGLPYGGRLVVDGTPVEGQLFGDDGAIEPAIRRGRAPSRAGDIALGAKVMDRLGLHIGDDVTVGARRGGKTISGRVVGESVLASPYFISFEPGTGAATVVSTFVAVGEPASSHSVLILLRYARDADPLRTFNAVEDTLGTPEAFEAADRAGSTGLDRVRVVPIVLVGGLLVLVAAAIAHVLLVSVRRRRQDLAVLSAIGFSRGQTRASLIVHGSLIAVVVCAIGIPLGVVVGRAAWMWIAGEFFVVSVPVVPVLLLAALTAVLVVLASAAALVPAARAARARPATVLRTH